MPQTKWLWNDLSPQNQVQTFPPEMWSFFQSLTFCWKNKGWSMNACLVRVFICSHQNIITLINVGHWAILVVWLKAVFPCIRLQHCCAVNYHLQVSQLPQTCPQVLIFYPQTTYTSSENCRMSDTTNIVQFPTIWIIYLMFPTKFYYAASRLVNQIRILSKILHRNRVTFIEQSSLVKWKYFECTFILTDALLDAVLVEGTFIIPFVEFCQIWLKRLASKSAAETLVS